MTYATAQDAIDLYGEDYVLTSVDRDENGEADPTAFDDALTQAQSQIDSYIGVIYDLPLAAFPDVLVRFTVDVAIYISSQEAGTGTEEKRQRYEDAISWLKQLVKGEVSLGLEDEPETKGGGVVISNETRRFTRTTTEGLL